MALTIEQARVQANDNSLWDSPFDIAKARLRLQALRILRDERPHKSGDESATLQFQELSAEIVRLEGFVDAEEGTKLKRKASVVRADFTEMRSRG